MKNGAFIALLLRFILHRRTTAMECPIQDNGLAEKKDIVDWMNLMRLVIDGYPVMDEDNYLAELEELLDEKRALVLREVDVLIGAMAFTCSPGSIEFLRCTSAISKSRTSKVILGCLIGNISSRAGNQHNNLSRTGQGRIRGSQDMLLQLGFAEKELLTEFGLSHAALCAPS